MYKPAIFIKQIQLYIWQIKINQFFIRLFFKINMFILHRRTRFDPLWNQIVVGGVHNGER